MVSIGGNMHLIRYLLQYIILIYPLCSVSVTIEQSNKYPYHQTKKIVVFQLCPARWELGFINELFPSNLYTLLNEKESQSLISNFTQGLSLSNDIPRVVIFSFYNAGITKDYPLVNKSIHLFHPAILVHLSDEFLGMTELYTNTKSLAHTFYEKVPLVLRQYGSYIYRSYEHPRTNVMQLPLGYKVNMLELPNGEYITSIQASRDSLKMRTSDRNTTWSFVGSLKRHTRERERQEILMTFKSWGHSVVASVPSPQMREIYNSSRFVLMTRGHANLACFRFFEAMICGAIPVVIGEQAQIDGEFEFDGDPPPGIYANTAKEALTLCQSLTDNEIDNLREKMVLWYLRRMELTRKKIDLYVKIFPFNPKQN